MHMLWQPRRVYESWGLSSMCMLMLYGIAA